MSDPRLPKGVPQDQVDALRYMRDRYGRKAKEVIRAAWWNGDYPHDTPCGELQRFRNSYGPSALCRVVMKHL